MPSFTTINKVSEAGFIVKYDTYETREEADARIVELHKIAGYEGAFVVNNDETAVNGMMCFHAPEFWPVDTVNKTITFNKTAKDAEDLALSVQEVQSNRRNAYQAEADTLFFEEQAGEVAAGTWAAKRAEIKLRFPK